MMFRQRNIDLMILKKKKRKRFSNVRLPSFTSKSFGKKLLLLLEETLIVLQGVLVNLIFKKKMLPYCFEMY